MSDRDDFTLDVKRTLVQRVGMRCSNIKCRKPTSGPRANPEKSINIGVAAHITAASSGGPRYDPSLSSDERKAITNGIWLCQNCAKLVDNDEDRYTATILRQWKKEAEDYALQHVEVNPESQNTELLMRKLEELVANLEKPEPPRLHTKKVYQVSGGLEPTHSNPQQNRLYTRRTNNGLVVNYMVRNDLLMLETIYPDGRTLVADQEVDGITIHKMPYPIEEMEIEIKGLA